MAVCIKSVQPVIEREPPYTFTVEISVEEGCGSTPAVSVNLEVGAEDLFDQTKMQILVAEQTGYLLTAHDNWNTALTEAWQEPEPKPDTDYPLL